MLRGLRSEETGEGGKRVRCDSDKLLGRVAYQDPAKIHECRLKKKEKKTLKCFSKLEVSYVPQK